MTETKTEENISQLKAESASENRLLGVLPDFKAHLIFWSLAIGGLLLDLWSKKAVFEWLNQEQSHSISIIDGFAQFIMALNPGAAFSLLEGRPIFLTGISVVALIVVFGAFLFSGTKYRLIHIALGLLTGGICGNLHDRIFNDGLVRDFIDVYIGNWHWPTFNVADILLCVGVGVMFISILITEKSAQKHARQQK